MIGCLRTHVHKQPINVLCSEFEIELSFITSGPELYIIRLLCRCAAVPAHEAYIEGLNSVECNRGKKGQSYLTPSCLHT